MGSPIFWKKGGKTRNKHRTKHSLTEVKPVCSIYLHLHPQADQMSSRERKQMAVAHKTGIPKWLALVSGNMGTKKNLCAPPV